MGTPHPRHQDEPGRAPDQRRHDTGDAPLASPDEIRARGDRRTRRRRAGAGAGAVIAVAAIAVVSATLWSPPPDGSRPVPPATGTPTTSVTASPKPPTSAGPTSSPRSVIDVSPTGVGQVPAAYFLPGRRWTGPDLMHGATIRSTEPRDYEGGVQQFMCDPDTSRTGDVAFVPAVRADGTSVGAQKVRLTGSSDEAKSLVATINAALPRCQERLREEADKAAGDLAPGEAAPRPTAEVTEDTDARIDDATGSLRLYTTVTDYGTGAGSRLVEWVAVAREGSAVTLISLNQLEEGDVSFDALRRIATEARAQLAWAAQQS